MSEVAHLRVITQDGELLPDGCPDCAEKEHTIEGLNVTIRSQAGIIGRQSRQLEEADPSTHPQHAEMAALIDRWKAATSHPRARRSKDRYEVIKAALKDGYGFPVLELAVDGIAAKPYVANGQRVAEGKPEQRHDALSIALKNGENIERFSNLGYFARKAHPERYNQGDNSNGPAARKRSGPGHQE